MGVALGPVVSGMGLEVQRPELVVADDNVGIARPGQNLAVGDVIELENAVFFTS